METDHGEDGLNTEYCNRRLPNAFILFCKKHRSIVKEKFPNLENRSITKILGEWWSSLEVNEKNVFNNLAAELKERHSHKEKEQVVRRPSNIIENSNNLSAAVVLAAASPIAPCWQKHRGQAASSWQPSPLLAQQLQQVQNSHPPSRNSSGSSSPEPVQKPSSGASSVTEAAPRKLFKQRYLADEQAKQVTVPDVAGDSEASACEALLQLADGGKTSSSNETTRSNSGSCSPKDSSKNGFQSLRDAVWSRVAQTILTQEKSRGSDCEGSDQPINFSNQCTIRGQTIIEHIIENILEDPSAPAQALNNNGTAPIDCPKEAERIKEIIYQSLKDDIMIRAANKMPDGFKGRNVLWNMLPNPTSQGVISTPVSEAATLQLLPTVPLPDLKASCSVAQKSESATPAVSVTLLPIKDTLEDEKERPLNLSTTPPQTPGLGGSGGPSVTITASTSKISLSDENDEEATKRSRSCKGRRYQEFKDAVGRKGRRSHRSGDSCDLMSEEETITPLNLQARSPSRPTSQPETNGVHQHYGRLHQDSGRQKFDVEKQLNAIPALDLDLFQQKIQNIRNANKNGAPAPTIVLSKRASENAHEATAKKFRPEEGE